MNNHFFRNNDLNDIIKFSFFNHFLIIKELLYKYKIYINRNIYISIEFYLYKKYNINNFILFLYMLIEAYL